MNKILYSRKFWTPLILALTGIIAILLYKNYQYLLDNWIDTLTISFGLIGAFTTMYNYWRRFNLFITRIWLILSNSSSVWNVTANFQGEFTINEYNEVIDAFQQREDITSFEYRSSTVVYLTINGLNYSLEYVDIEDLSIKNGLNGEINFYINDFNSSYDHSIKILEDEIIPNLRIIENITKAETKVFNFKVMFKERNPFIKLIVQNVNEKTVYNLWYSTVEETRLGRRDVKVSKNSIECTTTDIVDFQSSSTNYISLVGD